MKSLIVITKHCPNFTNLNFSLHLPPPPNLLIYQSSTRTHCVTKIPVQNQAVPTCSHCGPIFYLKHYTQLLTYSDIKWSSLFQFLIQKNIIIKKFYHGLQDQAVRSYRTVWNSCKELFITLFRIFQHRKLCPQLILALCRSSLFRSLFPDLHGQF